MMTTEKHCMVVKMNKIYCLIISSKINDYDECNLNKYMKINWLVNNNSALATGIYGKLLIFSLSQNYETKFK